MLDLKVWGHFYLFISFDKVGITSLLPSVLLDKHHSCRWSRPKPSLRLCSTSSLCMCCMCVFMQVQDKNNMETRKITKPQGSFKFDIHGIVTEVFWCEQIWKIYQTSALFYVMERIWKCAHLTMSPNANSNVYQVKQFIKCPMIWQFFSSHAKVDDLKLLFMQAAVPFGIHNNHPNECVYNLLLLKG